MTRVRRRRGAPLIMLSLALLVWGGYRAMIWQMPFVHARPPLAASIVEIPDRMGNPPMDIGAIENSSSPLVTGVRSQPPSDRNVALWSARSGRIAKTTGRNAILPARGDGGMIPMAAPLAAPVPLPSEASSALLGKISARVHPRDGTTSTEGGYPGVLLHPPERWSANSWLLRRQDNAITASAGNPDIAEEVAR